MTCQGITKRGISCKNKCKISFCYLHTEKVEFVLDKHNVLYEPIEGWPSLSDIRKQVKQNIDLPEINKILYNQFLICNKDDAFSKRLFFMTAFEIFFANPCLDYSEKSSQKTFEVMLSKVVNQPFLDKYALFFKKKFFLEYRKECQQKYTEFIFKYSILGPDIAKHIASFY